MGYEILSVPPLMVLIGLVLMINVCGKFKKLMCLVMTIGSVMMFLFVLPGPLSFDFDKGKIVWKNNSRNVRIEKEMDKGKTRLFNLLDIKFVD